MSHKKWLAIKVPSKLREKTVTCTRQIWSLLCIHWILFHENSNPIANERQCNDINLIMSGPVNAYLMSIEKLLSLGLIVHVV